MSASLPAAPSLEQLRKQAKDLLRAHRAGDEAAPRARRRPPSAARRAAQAQRRPARDRARARVPELAAAEGLRRAPRRPRARPRSTPTTRTSTTTTAAPTGCWPRPRTGPTGAVAAFERYDAPLTRGGARPVVAREHGFASWPALRRHVAGLRETGEPFARAYRAIEAHDVERLRGAARALPRAGRAPAARTATTCSAWPARPATSGSCAILLERGADVDPRQRARLDAAAPGRLQRPAGDGAHAARRRRAGRRLGARRRRHAARRRPVLGQPRDRRAARRARRRTRATCAWPPGSGGSTCSTS